MSNLFAEVDRFRSWADYPPDRRGGEWECDYEEWDRLYAAVIEFVDQKPFASWTAEEVSAVLYAMARDNEAESISDDVGERGRDLLLDLAEASLRVGEPDAKWQLATQLGYATTDMARREELLLAFSQDDAEYVRRRGLQALARIGSSATERVALEAWARSGESQQWARMTALWALHHVGSARLDPMLADAEGDERRPLAEFAAKVRRGDVDP